MRIATCICLLTTITCTLTTKASEMTLKQAFQGHFHIGSAFGHYLFNEENKTLQERVARQFSSITAENEMKWAHFQPKADEYRTDRTDQFVAFGTDNNMVIVGHVLFWHNQTPAWVFEDENGEPASRDLLLARMRQRVRYVANRYKGQIHAWDVVNEAINDNGSLRDSKWAQIIGEDWVEQAFLIAQEELPADVALLYNDYSMTANGRRNAVVKMVQDLKAKGIRIDAVGMQGHWAINSPSIQNIEQSIIAFSKTGVDVHITELDIDVLPRHPRMWSGNADTKLQLQQDDALDPYQDGLPEEIQQQLAERYKDIFRLFLKHSDKIKRVTFWGPTDHHTWLNNWPIRGRTSHPLLFDRKGNPKPAFHAVIAEPAR